MTTSPPTDATGTRAARTTGRTALLLAGAAGGAVALALGTYGRLHAPTGQAVVDLGPVPTIEAKVWLGSVAALLALAQLASALWLWGRLPALGRAPGWVATTHRWTGTAAFLVSLPVAHHCLWALGVQTTTPRVLVHSLLGCAFYGAVTTKLLALRLHGAPAWVLPVLGGGLVVLLVGLWLTSSLWFLTTAA